MIAVWTAGGIFTGCDPQFPESKNGTKISQT